MLSSHTRIHLLVYVEISGMIRYTRNITEIESIEGLGTEGQHAQDLYFPNGVLYIH